LQRFASVAILFMHASLAAAGDGWRRVSFECEQPSRGCDESNCCRRGVLVEAREVESSAIHQLRATGDIDASPADVFAVITAFEKQKGVAHIEEVRILHRDDREVIFWSMMNPPLLSRRDWVLRARLEPLLPGGTMRVTWEQYDAPDAPAPRPGVIRLRVNSGGWVIEPLGNGSRTHARYEMSIDPGGLVPAWAANRVMQSEMPPAFKAARRDAEQRAHASVGSKR